MRTPVKGAVAAGVAVLTAGGLAVGAGAVALPDGGDRTRAGAEHAPAERAEIREDFDGDGYNDLAVGAPTGTDGTGYVTVVYGSAEGLDRSSATTLHRTSDGGGQGGFGGRLRAEDLDGDGVTDLVVSGPGSEGVLVFWGAAGRGLSQDDHASLGQAHYLTTGDFDGDGARDVLLSGYMAAEETELLRGPFTRTGEPAERQVTDISNPGTFADVHQLIAGDVTGDGKDDLVVLQSMEEGARKGLFFEGGTDGLVRTDAELPMALGGTLGDFDGDGHQDLAYREAPDGVIEGPWTDAGTVHVRYGSAEGISSRSATFTQATEGVPGAHEEGDLFGASLAAGDVDGDGYDELAVGVPGEAVGELAQAGSVVLLRGGADGLTGIGAQAFSQDTDGVPGVAEAGDLFGAGVRLLDVDADGKADLAASAPRENESDGAVWSVPGSASGLRPADALSFGPGDVGAPQTGATFGAVFSHSTPSVLWGIGSD